MHYNKHFGIEASEYGWVPAPRYLLRRAEVLRCMSQEEPGRVLEVGCGTGALLVDLARRSFTGIGIETSQHARVIAKQVVNEMKSQFRIQGDLPSPAQEKFDYLLSFEVLEHIEDDVAALKDWITRLRPGGKALLSVPAHPEHWNSSDVWAGHFRRYTPKMLEELAVKAGLRPLEVVSYGWPLANMLEPLRTKAIDARLKNKNRTMLENTHRSGIERGLETKLYPYYRNPLGYLLFGFTGWLQQSQIAGTKGNGLLMIAKKN